MHDKPAATFLFTAAALLASPHAGAQPPALPEKWESVAPGAPEAGEFAQRCSGTSEADLRRMVSDAGANAVVTRRASDRARAYLAVNARRVICIRPSDKGFPLLPLEVYDKTVDFDALGAAQNLALRSALSAQLAARGVASALVKNEKGNAVLVTYMFTQPNPHRVHYQATFLRAGEFDEGRFETVIEGAGGFGVTGRGQSAEQYKPLFAE